MKRNCDANQDHGVRVAAWIIAGAFVAIFILMVWLGFAVAETMK